MSNLTKRQKRNNRQALKRKKRREERIEIRKLDEIVKIASIEDETWDAMCYKDSINQNTEHTTSTIKKTIKEKMKSVISKWFS